MLLPREGNGWLVRLWKLVMCVLPSSARHDHDGEVVVHYFPQPVCVMCIRIVEGDSGHVKWLHTSTFVHRLSNQTTVSSVNYEQA